jgi:hypothetical protein
MKKEKLTKVSQGCHKSFTRVFRKVPQVYHMCVTSVLHVCNSTLLLVLLIHGDEEGEGDGEDSLAAKQTADSIQQTSRQIPSSSFC